MFNKILIANRGEIACRIIKTTRAMGIHSVAIYSTADKDSVHVQQADSAYWVGEAQAKESYLNIAKIIDVAQECGAQAIHPGYGFLSENPQFAAACHAAGIVFIGPNIDALNAMASKQLAKQLLEATNVPLTPGYHGVEQDDKRLLIEAQKIGFPVLLKAANGGGGKGMRAVHHEAEFYEALAGARRESMASFADDTMIIEKLVLNPRHVEVQIMADNHGNVVHLFERDCSIQRRHQKIIEEAPAPNLSPALRQRLAAAACEVAQSINYSGAGTIEFLVDDREQFYFMEMNTRLQVEHPVTEEITGLDLVSWQLKIAANEALPLRQEQITAHGHAIECRIYAEDPHNNFLPSIGQIHYLKQPTGEGVRIDTGVALASSITRYYDPMIAKLIVWGSSRDEALQRMERALEHYFIGGVKTNIAFLQAICQNSKFRQAQLSTGLLADESLKLTDIAFEPALLMAISFDYLNRLKQISTPLLHDSFGRSMLNNRSWTERYLYQEEMIAATVSPISSNQLQINVNNKSHYITAALEGDELTMEHNGCKKKASIRADEHSLSLYTAQGLVTIERFYWHKLDTHASAQKGQLTAPMPATVIAVLKNIGESVKAGERLIILEAMKMEHTIHAPVDGILAEIFYAVGAQVNEGAELLSLSESA